MLPESMAPPLVNYDEFKAFMAERDIFVRRIYEYEWEDPETGEIHLPYWQITIAKEELRRDDRIHVFEMTVRDEDVECAWQAQWVLLTELLGMGWQAHLEEAGVA